MSIIPNWLYRLSSPKNFYRFAGTASVWCSWITLILVVVGLYYGLINSPPDYQQGDTTRIMYVHVPAAWMSMFVYMVMAGSAAVGMIWRIKASTAVANASAPVGAMFTALALLTGMLWGKPMWGTYWVWDARLTSELILLFLYLGYMALQSAIEDRETAARATAILALVGVVNIPIIHYSVEWWNTLHQGATVTKFDKPSIHISMLIPLLIMAFAFKFYYLSNVFQRARCELLEREKDKLWVRELLGEKNSE